MAAGVTADGRHFVRYRKGVNPEEPTRTIEYFGRGEEAREKAARRNAELHPPRRKKTPGLQFFELGNRYMRAKEAEISEADMERIYYTLSGIVNPVFGLKDVRRLSYEDFDAFVAMRRRKVKATTIHKDLSIVRAVLNWGVERRLIAASPFAGYKMPRRDDAVIAIPTSGELWKIIAAAAPHVKRAILIAYYTGLRPGPVELYSLTWDEYDARAGTLTVVSADKGGIPVRHVPVHPDLAAYLDVWKKEDKAAHLDARKKEDKWEGRIVHYKGKPVRSIKTSWKTALANAKIKRKFRPYSIRHKAISDMLESGADIKAVSEIVGHADSTMTLQVYQKTSSVMKRQAIAGLGVHQDMNTSDE
jgi:integrase